MLKNRAEVVVNTANLKHNFIKIKNLAGSARVISVVKANAYGHGAVCCARTIEECGGDMFAVATAAEAAILREGGIKSDIIVLGVTLGEDKKLLSEYNLIQAVPSEAYANELLELGKKLRIHIKIDTGMTRLGFYCHSENDIQSAYASISRVLSNKNFVCEGVFTHFACADMFEVDMTEKQFERFVTLCDYCEANNLRLGMRHCCNSSAIVRYPKMHLDAVRAGILLYGLSPNPDTINADDFLPCMSLVTNIVHVSHIKKGDTVSYGASYVCKRDMDVAVLSVGYADGLHRVLSGKASVVINGKKAPLVGKICMDMCVADVTGIDCSVDDTAIIFGEEQRVDVLASLAETINYEIVSNINERVIRTYK